MIRVGQMLYGYLGGYFDEHYGQVRVEAIGHDWAVVRDEYGRVHADTFDGQSADEVLSRFTEKPEEQG